jgi:hypothetical protein
MKNEDHHDLERLLAGLEPPPPPAGLRVRAVAAARERMAAAPDPDLWLRIWNHRGLRLAWAAAVVLLLAGHVLVSSRLGAVFTPNPPVLAGDQRDEQFLDILRQVRINADAQPSIGHFAGAADLDQIENGGNPS